MNGRKSLVMLAAILGLLVGVAPVYATPTTQGISAGGTVEVYNTEGLGLRVRSEPRIADDNVLGKAFDGTRLIVQDGPQTADSYTWWKVRLEGWTAAAWLAPAPSIGSSTTVQGTGDAGLRVRSSARIADDNILGKVFDGTRFQVLEGPQSADGNQWWRVRLEGWAAANWLRVVQAATDPEVECLARAIMSEASVGTREEQVAVAWTVFNRRATGTYGSTICEVVKAPGQYAYNQAPSQAILEIAQGLISSPGTDPTGGATHFFSPISMPKEGDSTAGYDVGGGLHDVPGIAKRVYFPSWTTTLEWTGNLSNVRQSYFMFYRQPAAQAATPAATPTATPATPTATPTATAVPPTVTPTPTAVPPTATPTPTVTPVPVGQAFRQAPAMDLRTVRSEAVKDQDAQGELVISNPTVNDPVRVVGEVLFRVPPDVMIYSTILGGSGGTGVVQAPFVNDPIPPGTSRTITIFARGVKRGDFAITAVVTYWPQGNVDARKSQNLTFSFKVVEPPLDLNRPPEELQKLLQQEAAQPTPTPKSGGGFSCSFSPSQQSGALAGVGDLTLFGVMMGAMFIWSRRRR